MAASVGSHNHIGDSGVTALAGALLQSIAFGNRISASGVVQPINSTLLDLKLRRNTNFRNPSAVLKALRSDWSRRLSCDHM